MKKVKFDLYEKPEILEIGLILEGSAMLGDSDHDPDKDHGSTKPGDTDPPYGGELD